MSANMTQNTIDEGFAADLVTAFVETGKAKPVLPVGRRGDIVALLTGLIAARDRFDGYCAALEAELVRRDVRLLLLQSADLDIPDQQIAREGFNSLTDDQLADIAISPEALHAIRDHLDDPETAAGEWLIREVLAAEAARPDDADNAERAMRIYDGLRKAGLLGTDRPGTIPFRLERRRARYHLARWIGPSLVLAASVLIGFFLGTQMRSGTKEVLLAQAEVKFGGERGGDRLTPHVEVESSARGFLTVIALLPGAPGRPVVIPSPFEKDIPVAPGQKADSGPFPAQARSARAALLVVTRTPAAAPIENYLNDTDARFAVDQIELLETTLRRALAEKNFEGVAVRRVTIAPPK